MKNIKIGDYVEAKIGNKTYLGKVDEISKHFVDIRLVFNGKPTVGIMRFPKKNVALDGEGKIYAEFLWIPIDGNKHLMMDWGEKWTTITNISIATSAKKQSQREPLCIP